MQSRGFPSDFLTELKRKNDLVSIASNYVQLQQKGRRFWACCPFPREKTPSFSIKKENGNNYSIGHKHHYHFKSTMTMEFIIACVEKSLAMSSSLLKKWKIWTLWMRSSFWRNALAWRCQNFKIQTRENKARS